MRQKLCFSIWSIVLMMMKKVNKRNFMLMCDKLWTMTSKKYLATHYCDRKQKFFGIMYSVLIIIIGAPYALYFKYCTCMLFSVVQTGCKSLKLKIHNKTWYLHHQMMVIEKIRTSINKNLTGIQWNLFEQKKN